MFAGRDGCTADAEHQQLRRFIAILGKLLVAVYTTILLEVFLHCSIRAESFTSRSQESRKNASKMNMFEGCSITSLTLAT